jgi:hypothetical protein
MFDQVISEMHPQVAKSLELIKDSYSILLKIVVESQSRQHSILQKQVNLLTIHNDKQALGKDADLQREKEKNAQLQKKLQTANQDRRVLLQLLKGKSGEYSDEPIKNGNDSGKTVPVRTNMKIKDNYQAVSDHLTNIFQQSKTSSHSHLE